VEGNPLPALAALAGIALVVGGLFGWWLAVTMRKAREKDPPP
jgi:hypothetical protein